MDNEDDKITVKTAFAAMYLFLENEYRLTNSGEIGGLLGGMSLLVEGGTADPAVWDDWIDAVEAASRKDCDIHLKIEPK